MVHGDSTASSLKTHTYDDTEPETVEQSRVFPFVLLYKYNYINSVYHFIIWFFDIQEISLLFLVKLINQSRF